MSKPIHHILFAPLLTEKSVRNIDAGAGKKYTFKVSLDANKVEIAQAVEAMFAKDKVKVASVNTLKVRGKERRTIGRRLRPGSQTGKAPDWKKAIVTLTADSPNIPMLEGV